MLYIFSVTIIDLLGYIGNIISVIGGTLAAKRTDCNPIIQFLSGISTAFWGDMFFRDIILLHTSPYILNHPIETVIAVIIDITVIVWMKNKYLGKAFSLVLSIVNSINIVLSATLGYERGIAANKPWWFCIVTAWVSVCGGEIIAVAIKALGTREFSNLTKALNENKFYYFFCAFVSMLCGCLNEFDINNNTALIILIIFVIGSNLFIENKRLTEKQ